MADEDQGEEAVIPTTILACLELGAPFREWCDECMVTHYFARAYLLTVDGVVHAGTWGDHNERAAD